MEAVHHDCTIKISEACMKGKGTFINAAEG